MKKTIAVLFLSLLFSGYLNAQTNKIWPSESSTIKETQKSLKGTYQIQIAGNSRAQMVLPEDIYQTIAHKREKEKVVYHYITEKIRIKILSEKIISQEGFKPIDEQVILKCFDEK
jgi:hypothetical protein